MYFTILLLAAVLFLLLFEQFQNNNLCSDSSGNYAVHFSVVSNCDDVLPVELPSKSHAFLPRLQSTHPRFCNPSLAFDGMRAMLI
jgi:hypothetical protein